MKVQTQDQRKYIGVILVFLFSMNNLVLILEFDTGMFTTVQRNNITIIIIYLILLHSFSNGY